MTKYLFCLFFISIIDLNVTQAQNDQVWAFGSKAGIDFNQNPPVAIRTAMIEASEGTASVSDALGQLLFYTNGSMVWNRNHTLMPNGRNLMPSGAQSAYSSTQGSLIVQMPGSTQKYYVFSQGDVFTAGESYYSIVDMDLANGLGDVVQKGNMFNTPLTEMMTAVAADDCSVWLVVATRMNHKSPKVFLSYKIDERGIALPITSPNVLGYGPSVAATAQISPDRRKMAVAMTTLALYDFDPATGVVSNAQMVDDGLGKGFFYTTEFSADGSKLYAKATNGLYQYNLIPGNTDTAYGPIGARMSNGALRRGPDGKIYCSEWQLPYLNVIHRPNEQGAACQYVPQDFQLLAGTMSMAGFPNVIVTTFSTVGSQSKDSFYCIDSVRIVARDTTASDYTWNDGSKASFRFISKSGLYWVRYMKQDPQEKCATMHVDSFLIQYDEVKRFNTTTSLEGVCKQDTFHVYPKHHDVSDYQWQDGSKDLYKVVQKEGVYWVRYRIDSLCSVYTDSFMVNYPEPTPRVSFATDTLVCVGDSISFINTSPVSFNQFSWIFDKGDTSTLQHPSYRYTAPGNYRVVLQGTKNGICPSTYALTVTVDPYPKVVLDSDRRVCQWTSVGLESFVTPYRNNYTYQWGPEGAGFTFPDQPSTSLIADSSGTYYLRVSTPAGCTGVDSIRLTVIPGAFGNVIPDTGFCVPGEVQLWASGGVDYLWVPGAGLSDTSVAHPIAQPATSTRYTVYIRDEYDCMDSLKVTVSVYPNAVVNIPDTIKVYPGEAYHLQPGTNCSYFEWFPPSGASSTQVADPWLSPEVRTRYFVTARTEHGCQVEDSIDVLVEETVWDVPNAFAPGSSTNGLFTIAKRGIIELKRFAVFNRWGNKVFETTDIDQGWDGTHKGVPQPVGVYIYTVEGTTVEGKPVVKNGNVTLLR